MNRQKPRIRLAADFPSVPNNAPETAFALPLATELVTPSGRIKALKISALNKNPGTFEAGNVTSELPESWGF